MGDSGATQSTPILSINQDILMGINTFLSSTKPHFIFKANEYVLTQSTGWVSHCFAAPDTCHSLAVKGRKGQDTVSKMKKETHFSTKIELDKNHHHK